MENSQHIERAESALQTPTRNDEDAVLVGATLDGDERAFERIMRRYNQRLYRLAVSVLGDPSEAHDVLQESFVRAFYLLSSFTAQSSLGAWLARIVRNEAIDRLRARAARNKLITLEADLPQNDNADSNWLEEKSIVDGTQFDLETNEARTRMRRVLEQAIQSLPEQFRAVFVLRELEGLSIKEAAEYLDIPSATVKTRDHRARSMLRELLDKRIDTATKEAFAFMGPQCDAVVEYVMARLSKQRKRT